MATTLRPAVLVVVAWLCAVPLGARGSGSQAAAQSAALPEARDIVERHIEAIGGREVLLSHSSRHVTGTVVMPANGITGSFEVFEAKPNKTVLRMSLAGLGEMSEGFNGEIGWSVNPVTGPSLDEGRQLEDKKLDADFYSDLNLDTRYSSMKTLERVEFDGRPCYKVALARRSGGEDIHYYEVETGLRAGSVTSRETVLGTISATVTESDYKRFGKILYPTKVTLTSMNISQVLTVVKVEFDKVDSAEFELPPAIKALVK